MHVHILGICGTFMGGLAYLAKELNFKVTGSDTAIYPPMSTQIEALKIPLIAGYDSSQRDLKPDYFIVGNVMSRGMPIIETLLNEGLPMLSGPDWLARFVLSSRHVLAVSGTHGKTTTTSMLAWILEYAGLNPGFLIGGVPNNFNISARLGAGQYFVIEADEYDSAFFDKRSKFIHYRPRTLIVNNIEFDHADIFPDLKAIQQQFHHLIRTIPNQGRIIYPNADLNVKAVIDKGCWSPTTTIGLDADGVNVDEHSEFKANLLTPSGERFEVFHKGQSIGLLEWRLCGEHNVSNALAAIAAAFEVGVSGKQSLEALKQFKGVKRRLEVKGVVNGITVYDDFAHHPTAIATTLKGLRARLGPSARIIAVIDIRSNTMKAGHHQTTLSNAFDAATEAFFFKPDAVKWDVPNTFRETKKPGGVFEDTDSLLATLQKHCLKEDHLIFMSNGGFGGIQAAFLKG